MTLNFDRPVDKISPWTIKACSTQTRAIVTHAARVEGITVGQWLDKRVEEWVAAGEPVIVERLPSAPSDAAAPPGQPALAAPAAPPATPATDHTTAAPAPGELAALVRAAAVASATPGLPRAMMRDVFAAVRHVSRNARGAPPVAVRVRSAKVVNEG